MFSDGTIFLQTQQLMSFNVSVLCRRMKSCSQICCLASTMLILTHFQDVELYQNSIQVQLKKKGENHGGAGSWWQWKAHRYYKTNKTKQNKTSKNRGSKAFQKDRNDLRGMWTTWEEILPEETSLAFRH